MTNDQTSEPKEAFMDVRYLKKLIKVVEDSQISELEIEDQGGRVKIIKHSPQGPAMVHMAPGYPHQVPAAPAAGGASPAPAAAPLETP